MKKFEITKEQIIELSIQNNIEIKLKNWFPDAFKTKFTGWAKDIHEINEDWIAYYENDILKYGINANGDWFESKSNANYNECVSNREATEKEVETALINEAKKRGFENGIYFKVPNSDVVSKCTNNMMINPSNNSILYFGNYCIFKNGKWATIIETITKEEAEKLLNKKII